MLVGNQIAVAATVAGCLQPRCAASSRHKSKQDSQGPVPVKDSQAPVQACAPHTSQSILRLRGWLVSLTMVSKLLFLFGEESDILAYIANRKEARVDAEWTPLETLWKHESAYLESQLSMSHTDKPARQGLAS